MKSCNVVSLTKISELDGENIESSQVLEAILNNSEYIEFENSIIDEKKGAIVDFLSSFSKDIITINNTFIRDLTINIVREEKMLDIMVNFIYTDEKLNDELFDKSLEYYDKYEELIMEADLVDFIHVDFNVTTRTENLRIITRYVDGV